MWINGILFNVLFPEGRGTPMLSVVMLVGNILRDSKVAKCLPTNGDMSEQNSKPFCPFDTLRLTSKQ